MMTDDEKEILKTGAEAALKPFSNLIEKLFGGAIEQIGGMWEDQLRVRRSERRLKLYARVQEMIEEAGFEPKEIPEKLWVPAMQAASLEDEETLREKWAALLANASRFTWPNGVPTSYPEILRQLSTPDIWILDGMYNKVGNAVRGTLPIAKVATEEATNTELLFDMFNDLESEDALRSSEFPWRILTIHAEHLQRLGLVRCRDVLKAPILSFTNLGFDFVRTCRAPKPAEH